MLSKEVTLFEKLLIDAGQDTSFRALKFVTSEMTAGKGYSRHDGSDYYVHCVAVAQDLWDHGIRDENIISAALLHDAEEDIQVVTRESLTRTFNTRIAEIVHGVSKLPDINYKEGENIKTLYLGNILEDIDMCVVKTSDRKHNFSTLKDATNEKQMRQAIETETFFFPFFKEATRRYPEYADYFMSGITIIEPLLIEIKERN